MATKGERGREERGMSECWCSQEAQGLEWAWRQFVVVAVAAVGAQFQSVCFTFLHIDSTAKGEGKGNGEGGRTVKNFHFGFRPFAF